LQFLKFTDTRRRFYGRCLSLCWNNNPPPGKWREGKERMKLENYGRRLGLAPTRAGWIERVFFVCYECGNELEESELQNHADNHEGGQE